jgi:hypothetical protein
MGFVFFIIGVRVEIALLVLLPFFIAMLGTAVAIGLVIALPLVGAVLILIGIVQGDPDAVPSSRNAFLIATTTSPASIPGRASRRAHRLASSTPLKPAGSFVPLVQWARSS